MKNLLLIFIMCFHFFTVNAFPEGNITFKVVVHDEDTKAPLKNIPVTARFGDRPVLWGDKYRTRINQGLTDNTGMCRFIGKSNYGEANYSIKKVVGYYDSSVETYIATNQVRNFLPYRCEPYDCTYTTLLQRIKSPISLFVKNVKIMNRKNCIVGVDDTETLLRFDFLAGDWLPPLGIGKNADMIIRTEFRLNETISNRMFKALTYYDFINTIEFPEAGNGILEKSVDGNLGLKIRIADATGYVPNKILCFGRRQKKNAVIKGVCPEEYTESDPNRCYCFRVRSQFDEKGNMISAIYGKIYGDFKFDGFDKKGLTGIEFLYYLNPRPLDRNLEWDMKTNLCPNPGSLGQKQP
jgi:hypothetical protein